MFQFISALVAKDLRILFLRGSSLSQALLLGLVLIFLFSLAQGIGEHLSAQSAATIFWMSSLFCQVLVQTQLYALEEEQATRDCLLLLPVPIQSLWLGKTISALFLLLLAQALFLPAIIVFLGQNMPGDIIIAFGSILLTDIGLAALGSLLGALAQGQASKESLLSILLFPLLTPLLFSAISLLGTLFSAEQGAIREWLAMGAAFDAIFLAAGFLLFPFIYSGSSS